MSTLLTFSTVLMAKQAFFFFFGTVGESQEEHDKKTEEFLNNDEFTIDTIRDVENSLLLKELQKLKDEYRENYYGELNEIANKFSAFGYNHINRVFKHNRIQISRLRLLIQPDTIVSVNKSSNKEQKYSVMRAYWMDDSGKKVLKFSLSLGNTSNLRLSDGKIDFKTIYDAEKEIKRKIKDLYVDTYGPL